MNSHIDLDDCGIQVFGTIHYTEKFTSKITVHNLSEMMMLDAELSMRLKIVMLEELRKFYIEHSAELEDMKGD